jgi:hypothetical protein
MDKVKDALDAFEALLDAMKAAHISTEYGRYEELIKEAREEIEEIEEF